MKIAVLSGKGGTGKTTVSTNLSILRNNIVLIDTDVEEPNSHIFMKPQKNISEKVYVDYPTINQEKCNLCGDCGEFCNFNSIIPAKNTVLVFKESCHACGGCKIVCPTEAITYSKREIGSIIKGRSKFDTYMEYGLLNLGELSGVKIIETLKKNIESKEIVIIDSPPGTSCSTVAAVEDADYALLVTEPTPFGVSDMKMVIEMLREMKISFGVFINKAGLGDNEVYEYCNKEDINILGELPFDKKIAELYSKGEILSSNIPEYKSLFEDVLNKIMSNL